MMILLNELNNISKSATLSEKLGKVIDFINALSDEILDVGKKSDNVGKIVADRIADGVKSATQRAIAAVRSEHTEAEFIRKNSQKLN